MTRFESIDIEPTDDYWCDFCECDANYIITYLDNRELHVCKKCLSVINQKAALIDGNEEI